MDLPIENGGSFHSFLYVYQRVSVKPTCFCCGGNHLTSSLLAESRPAGGRLGTDAPSPGRSLWPVQKKKRMFQGFSGDIPHITVFSLKLMLPGGVYKVTSGYGPIFSKPLRDHRQRDLGNIKNLSSDKAIQGEGWDHDPCSHGCSCPKNMAGGVPR